MRKTATELLSLLTCIAGLTAIAVCLLCYEDDYLWKVQELNLHLDTPLFFQQQMVVPGGLLMWLGTYFTEFFYHPLLGVGWLCLWWALLMILAMAAFRVPRRWAVLLLIPVALLLLTCVDMGYWIYYLKLRGHFFVATIGLCSACAAVWAFSSIPGRRFLREAFIVVSTAVLYPLTGFYGLLATLLMGIMAWRLEGSTPRRRVADSLLATVAIVVVPLVCYHTMYHQTSLENIYQAALPLFCFVEKHGEYYLPYYGLTAFFCLLAAMPRQKSDVGGLRRWTLGHVVILGMLTAGVKAFWYHDYNFEKELRMTRCMNQGDWEGIIADAADLKDEPTRAMVMLKNLALFRLGRQGNEMYHYRTGAKESNSPLPVNMTHVAGRSIYFYYGLPNFCYRWCLEDGVEYGWRPEYLKYMAECALLNGEHKVARKYIDQLRHTRYHRLWAEEKAHYLDNEQAIADNPTYATIRHLMNFNDKLNSDHAVVENYLMRHFVYDPSPDTLYHEQAVYSALWTKDISIFWRHFASYAQEHVGQPMPVHLQEAAYLYGHLENQVDISNMPFDNSVKQQYDAFMEAAQRYGESGMTEEQMRQALYRQFGNTFYYEYFFIRDLKLY